MADLRGELASNLVVLRKTGGETVTGRFRRGHFMWLRAEAGNPLRKGGSYLAEINVDNPRHASTTLDPALLDDPDLRFLIQRLVPTVEHIWRTDRAGRETFEISAGSSCAYLELSTHDNGTRDVTEFGPHEVWQQVEATTRLWLDLHRPARDEFGLTAANDGTHTLWLGQPDSQRTWILPSAP